MVRARLPVVFQNVWGIKMMLSIRSGWVALAAFASLMPQQASAAIWCAGKVHSVLVAQDGTLQANWGFTNIVLCNVTLDKVPPAPLTPITAKTCESVYSMLLTAQATGRDFMALLNNDSSCTGWAPNGNWSDRSIGTFMIL